jgi:hypothetical protein
VGGGLVAVMVLILVLSPRAPPGGRVIAPNAQPIYTDYYWLLVLVGLIVAAFAVAAAGVGAATALTRSRAAKVVD